MADSIEGPPPIGRGDQPPSSEKTTSPKGSFDTSHLPDIWPNANFTPEQKQQFWNTFMNMISNQIKHLMEKAREAIKKMGEEYKE